MASPRSTLLVLLCCAALLLLAAPAGARVHHHGKHAHHHHLQRRGSGDEFDESYARASHRKHDHHHHHPHASDEDIEEVEMPPWEDTTTEDYSTDSPSTEDNTLRSTPRRTPGSRWNHTDIRLRRNEVVKHTVELPYGAVTGQLKVAGAIKYFSFQGIPYAKAPVGTLRFKNPVPISENLGTIEALRDRPMCTQITMPERKFAGQEDCLYLNVFIPSKLMTDLFPTEPELPVMVYFHGGGFQFGSSREEENGPEFFMATQEVILVTFNYRLGAFGFLNLDNDNAPGNMGLKDQQMVLLWVQQNIAKFGGNPRSVTLFGNSAGAASVHYHSIVRASEGLFNRIILQSGNALAAWAYQDTHKEMARRLAATLLDNNSTVLDLGEAWEVIRDRPNTAILAATVKLIAGDLQLRMGYPVFGPSPERRADSSQSKFLTRDPESMVANARACRTETIVGLSGQEGYFAHAFLGLSSQHPFVLGVGLNPNIMIPPNIAPSMDASKRYGLAPIPGPTQEQGERFSQCLKDYYDMPGDVDNTIYDMVGDLFTHMPTHRLVDMHLKLCDPDKSKPMFVYNFTMNGDYNWGKKTYKLDSLVGATHTDELGYLFRITSPVDLKQDLDKTTPSSRVLDNLTRLWTSFARAGIPAAGAWPRALASATTTPVANISEVLVKSYGIGGKRMGLWEELFGEFRHHISDQHMANVDLDVLDYKITKETEKRKWKEEKMKCGNPSSPITAAQAGVSASTLMAVPVATTTGAPGASRGPPGRLEEFEDDDVDDDTKAYLESEAFKKKKLPPRIIKFPFDQVPKRAREASIDIVDSWKNDTLTQLMEETPGSSKGSSEAPTAAMLTQESLDKLTASVARALKMCNAYSDEDW